MGQQKKKAPPKTNQNTLKAKITSVKMHTKMQQMKKQSEATVLRGFAQW